VKTSSVVLAAIAAFGVMGLRGAGAEPFGPPIMEGVPPYQVMNMVRASGFRPLGPPARRGPVYLLRAIDPDGDEVRLAVDANSGRVLSVAAVDDLPPRYGAPAGYETLPRDEPAPPYGRPGPYHYGAPEPMRSENDPYGPPPNAAPPRPAAPVNRAAAVTLPHTPLPRPRPAEPAIATPSDVSTTAPQPAAQTSPNQTVVPPGNDAASQGAGQDKPAEKPAEKPTAEKPTAMPPVTPLD